MRKENQSNTYMSTYLHTNVSIRFGWLFWLLWECQWDKRINPILSWVTYLHTNVTIRLDWLIWLLWVCEWGKRINPILIWVPTSTLMLASDLAGCFDCYESANETRESTMNFLWVTYLHTNVSIRFDWLFWLLWVSEWGKRINPILLWITYLHNYVSIRLDWLFWLLWVWKKSERNKRINQILLWVTYLHTNVGIRLDWLIWLLWVCQWDKRINNDFLMSNLPPH